MLGCHGREAGDARSGLLGFQQSASCAKSEILRRIFSGSPPSRRDFTVQDIFELFSDGQNYRRKKGDSRNQYSNNRMIKNDRQYRLTKAQTRAFEDAIVDLSNQPIPPGV